MQTENARKTALITGATGFVGGHLAQRLFAEGWDVHAIVRHNSDISPSWMKKPALTVHEHDGSARGMTAIVADAKPSVVFHLASLFLVQHQSRDLEPMVRSNILFGTQLLEAMVENNASALVNTGTSWQHYENKPYSPVNLYAATKQAFLDIVQFYTEATPMKAITLKLFDTYGPGDPRPKLFTLLRSVAQEQKELAMSPGEQVIDLVYIDDIVEAFLIAADRVMEVAAAKNESYALSSGNPIKLRELVNIYSSITGKNLPIKWGERPYRLREVMVPWNTGRILPGWRPMTGLKEGIKRMENI
jgi:nucleoside-diphosphate-sugar epimerase